MIETIKSVYRFLSPRFQSVHLDYTVNVEPRYGHGKPVHTLLYEIINQNRSVYEENLLSFMKYADNIQLIKDASIENDEEKPTWNNGYLPGLDILGIYGILAKYKPAKYIEIGSGNSTKVARYAITENQLSTEITSIDPFPRANIDHLADKIIRKPFENISDNRFIIESLKESDILFIDNSHRVFANSDAMICFLELLPNLRKGVIVHFHDIYLPYDYPQFMCDRFYNEQYMLAAFILANPSKYQSILPNYFISEDEALSNLIAPLWNHPNLLNAERHGGSFWLQIN